MNTTLTQQQIRTLFHQAQQTIELFEQAKQREILQHYERNKHFRKGDRKGLLGKHNADQTYDDYDHAELDKFCRSGSAFYNLKHRLYQYELVDLCELVRLFRSAISLDLQSVTVAVKDLAMITSRPQK